MLAKATGGGLFYIPFEELVVGYASVSQDFILQVFRFRDFGSSCKF